MEKRIKRQIIGKNHRFEAVVPLGFEETLVNELKLIGVECNSDEMNGSSLKVAGDGKVEFTSKITEAWKAVAYSRIANRILMEVASFKAENFGQLEKGVGAVPWELYLPAPSHLERSAAIDDCHLERSAAESRDLDIHVTCKHSRLYHSDAVKERVQEVIQNLVQDPVQDQPHKAGGVAMQHLYVRLVDDRCTIWLDLAGEELYKRGHERYVAEAPLKETIAAAMIFEAVSLTKKQEVSSCKNLSSLVSRLSSNTILDPMAGSGTFSLEAAYIANGLIPGKCRDFALKHQPAFKEGTWNFILKGAANSDNVAIITSDISQRPIDIIKHNAEVSPLPAGVITPQLKDFFSYTVTDFIKPADSDPDVIILLNPPYGKRLDCDAPKLYTKIGQKLCEFKGSIVAILAPKDDTRNGAKYTCTANLLKACPALNPRLNSKAKLIETSHGGFSLNAIFAKI